MVFRGKPSAACDNCRKARKRCGLEQPACLLCVKQKKVCSGYRDTTQLVVHDQSESVRRKVERQQAEYTASKQNTAAFQRFQQPNAAHYVGKDVPTFVLANSESSSDSESDIDEGWNVKGSEKCYIKHDFMNTKLDASMQNGNVNPSNGLGWNADEIASEYFFRQFTSDDHWSFIRKCAQQAESGPCLGLAVRACGMAALMNVHSVARGKDYARLMYVDALALLNQALRDPIKSKTDESLIAVTLLGFYENITCDQRQSLTSWQSHVGGAAQLLKLRGKQQFQRSTGRSLFRETRTQVLTECLWGYKEVPKFLEDYQAELEAQTPTDEAVVSTLMDKMSMLNIRLANLRARLNIGSISDVDAAIQASGLERRLIDWSEDAVQNGGNIWQYREIDMDDEENVWDGKAFAYAEHSAPIVWNRWRCSRIMLSRTQESLCGRVVPGAEREDQVSRFRKVRRQMTDDICATMPACLGHVRPASSPRFLLTSAYLSIWPLFFAGTCTLERVGSGAWSVSQMRPTPPSLARSAAYAQIKWILGRLEYVSLRLGLKLADGVASPLRGEFRLQEGALSKCAIMSWTSRVTTPDHSPWLQKINMARCEPQK